MLFFIIIPFVLARIKRYSIKPVFKVIDLYPLFLVEAFHLTFQISFIFKITYFVKYATLIQNLFIIVLLLPILRRKIYYPTFFGCGLTVAGTFLNKLVINANGGKMPVLPTLSLMTGYVSKDQLSGNVDSLHILMTESTKLNFLADYIDLGFSVLSPGDVLIHTFVSIIIFYTIKKVNSENFL